MPDCCPMMRVARPGFIEELRLVPDLRDQDRLAGRDHLAGHAFAQPVAPLPLFAFGNTPGRIHDQFGIIRAQDRNHAAVHSRVDFENLKDLLHELFQIAALAEHAGDMVENREAVESEIGFKFREHHCWSYYKDPGRAECRFEAQLPTLSHSKSEQGDGPLMVNHTSHERLAVLLLQINN